MKIERPQLIAALMDFALSGNGIVIGQPGIGKSHALAELHDRLTTNGILHIILSVERLGGASDAELKAELEQDVDFISLLHSLKTDPKTPAILIFDGYDAARGEQERTGVLQLIRRAVVNLHDWHTIVSVRTFDATKSQRLLNLFQDNAPVLGNAKPNCRQLVIPALNASEIEQALVQLPSLRKLHDEGTLAFRNLLTVPFNLWLIECVLRAGANTSDFSAITSEVQLLNMYWNFRVRHATEPENREYILKTAAQEMVRSHSLKVRRDLIYKPEVRQAWDDLLSDELLKLVSQNDTSNVAFAHNILFDFAVSTHLLDSDPNRLAAFVAEEPARPLFLRPSLVYHFTLLWHFDRNAFWYNFWAVIQNDAIHLRQIVRLVLPAVVVNEAQAPDDLFPLTERLLTDQHQSAEAITFLLQALRVLKSSKSLLWASFLRSIGAHLDSRFAWEAGRIGLELIESGNPLLQRSLTDIGEFGRCLLEWAWDSRTNVDKKQWFERLTGLVAIPLVAQTYNTNALDAKRLFTRILAVMSEPDFPIDCVYRLTESIEHIIPCDAELVADIYEHVFCHDETSQKQTTMGGSSIMYLLSNRRQDYDMCRYNLIEKYPTYLEYAFLAAMRTGVRAVQAFAFQRHVQQYLIDGKTRDSIKSPFSFLACEAQIVGDCSAIWDSSSYPDKELEIANLLFAGLLDLAKVNKIADIDSVFDMFKTEMQMAFLWSRLLTVGTHSPSILGLRLWELAKAKPIIESNDTLFALGNYLERTYEYFTESQRQQIEDNILDIVQPDNQDDNAWRERRRDRLISLIPTQYLTTSSAKQLKLSLELTNSLYSNTPLCSSSSSWRKVTDENILDRQGVNTDAPANLELRELYWSLAEWCDGNKDDTAIDGLMPTVCALSDLLSKPSKADERQLSLAWVRFSGFVSKALLLSNDPTSIRFETLRTIILKLARHEEPKPNSELDASWNIAAWSPSPRTEAAQALPWLTHFGKDKEALEAIQQLSHDPVPAVRFLIACELWRVVEHMSTEMWLIFDTMADTEQNGIVLQGITNSLWRLIVEDNSQSLVLIKKLMRRVKEDTDSDDKARPALISMTVDYAVQQEDQWAKDMIASWQSAPLQFPGSISRAGHRLVEHIQPQHHGNQLANARSLLLTLIDGVADGLCELQKQGAAQGEQQDKRQNTMKLLYGVINDAVMRMHFAADIVPTGRKRTKPQTLNDDQRKAFFTDILPILQRVIDFGLVKETGMLLASTAHHFMQLLNGVLNYDPPLVLRLASEVVTSSKRFDYTIDSMAMRETVTLVETILADHRESIQDASSINNLLNLLDAFVEVGWPEALHLVWRLDEIYR